MKKGEYTFIAAQGKSTIDLAIINNKMSEIIKFFEILQIPLSDHQQILLTLNKEIKHKYHAQYPYK